MTILKKSDDQIALRFSKKIVITMFISVLAFTVTMIVIYCVTGAVPDMLIDKFYGFFGIEGGALGIVTVSKNLYNFLTGKKEKSKNENPVLHIPQDGEKISRGE